ncbi:MAG: hypothetical protein IPH06_06360 [Alphaproteobacteria bacterium]|nr:hypothetical protein [Alphaproteobacteria bacterium]QQS57641.1 MAG: hypothetical protein IPN28_02125 [Alphaproteobacteria bacterium]
MIFDNIDYSKLPSSGEEAFIEFERQLRHEYNGTVEYDRNVRENTDMNGNYIGSYAPERAYLNSIMAFIDEYNLDLDIADCGSLRGYEFYEKFEELKAKIGYAVTRFSIRKHRIGEGTVGTLIYIESSYKAEIGSLLEKIRKIVNQEVKDVKKRDHIFSKIASLQSEVDRDQTTVDALFSRMLDLSSTIGESAENLEPLINLLERIKKVFWDKSNKVELLPQKERQKLITKENKSSEIDEFEDEIPF